MILVKDIEKKISGGTAPYTFTFEADDSCVAFSNAQGTISSTDSGGNYTAKTNISFANEACIGTAVITVTFEDANGCSISEIVQVSNPCTLVNSISNNEEFVFVSNTTGGSGSYTYQWNYDNLVFDTSRDTDATDSILALSLKSGYYPTTTTISVKVTDDITGCEEYTSYSYTFCIPDAGQGHAVLVCNATAVTGCASTPVSSYINYDISRIISTSCAGQVIDYSHLEIALPLGICVVNNGNGTINIVSTLSSVTKTINYRISSTTGVHSEWNSIIVTVPLCAKKSALSGTPLTIQLTADDIVTDVKLLPVEPRVYSNSTIDWSTFTITNTPSWGTATFNGDREIEYEITDITTTTSIPDVIKWSVQTTDGAQINITDTVLRDVIAAPVAVNDTEICATCGTATDPWDVLANDTGDIDRSTLVVVSTDPDIIVTKDTDNNLIFTSLPGASFTNINTYKVANTQGAYSNTASAVVKVACATPQTPLDITCFLSKAFDLLDYFDDVNCFGTVWAETTASNTYVVDQGGTIIGVSGSVDFTGIDPQEYTFELTCQNVASCSPTWDNITEITVINGETPAITITSHVNNADGTNTCGFDYTGVVGLFTITNNATTPTYKSTLSVDGTSGVFTYYNVSGNNVIIVSATSVCNNTVSDTDTVIV